MTPTKKTNTPSTKAALSSSVTVPILAPQQEIASVMLTTVDNPYDPFTDWYRWLSFDTTHGYHTCGLLARLLDTESDEGTNPLDLLLIDEGFDSIINLYPDGKYKKVYSLL